MTVGHEKLDVSCLSIGYCVKENSAVYGFQEIDFDPDSDFDFKDDIYMTRWMCSNISGFDKQGCRLTGLSKRKPRNI
ncbi:MAG: hypothetical protein JW882_02040 [Deltaproteobacteria bacterium]|nr:hypothetical protein [Deltaproteobacteria bacterium]